MINRDPRCVFVTDKPGQADVVVVWLEQQDIPTQVMNPSTQGGLDGLTPFSASGVSARGIEVWVMDPDQAPKALELLADHVISQDVKTATSAPVDALCEECGKSTVFPGEQRGTVQECPECGAFMDVLEEEEEWVEPEEEGEEGEPE